MCRMKWNYIFIFTICWQNKIPPSKKYVRSHLANDGKIYKCEIIWSKVLQVVNDFFFKNTFRRIRWFCRKPWQLQFLYDFTSNSWYIQSFRFQDMTNSTHHVCSKAESNQMNWINWHLSNLIQLRYQICYFNSWKNICKDLTIVDFL